MLQTKVRTHPLRRMLDALLARAVEPFATARTLEQYGTNGYYFVGLSLAFIILLLWAVGMADVGRASPLSVWLRDEMRQALGISLPAAVPPVLLLVLLYTFVGLYKPARVFVGEVFADTFFRLVSLGITAGDWFAEHRWNALLTIVALTSLITWGLYYVLEAARRP
jgi:hypothetical protein